MANPLRKLLPASLAVLLLLTLSSAAHADARFDLAGPRMEVHVTRSGVTLPIAQVPNLQPGDKIWLHPDFPPTQSVHYLLVAVFLRGTTNPPPDNWFNRIETWKPQVRAEGVSIVVPAEAQQVLLFLAPETSGDFSTLRSAVKGRPGIFVRASQDLNAAGFEEARIERYLEAMRSIPAADSSSKELLERSNLLARTLNLKPNADCFKLPLDQQITCLTQSGNQLLLDDGHGQSVAANLTSGASNDFINATTYTGLAGGGLYSAYVGAIIDLVRLTSTLHTAQYQYIPAIAFPAPADSPAGEANQDQLNLRLNAPPSFHNPKSVIVIGLPAIQPASPPPLVAANPDHVACLLKPKLVLGLVGAPLVYSTGFAHNLVLHLNTTPPSPDIPLMPDAFEGGLVVAPPPTREPLPLDQGQPASTMKSAARNQPASASASSTRLTGTVKGMWGFDAYTGPTLPLEQRPGKDWHLLSADPLVAGEDNHLTLAATGVECVQSITTERVPQPAAATAGTASNQLPSAQQAPATGKLEWKPLEASAGKSLSAPHEIALTLPLALPTPESVRILIHQYGESEPVTITAKALGQPATIASLTIHANDTAAVLTGTGLDQVSEVKLGAAVFKPTPGHPPTTIPANSKSTAQAQATQDAKGTTATETLTIDAINDLASARLTPGEELTASIQLKDGREFSRPVVIAPSRPRITILSRSIAPAEVLAASQTIASHGVIPIEVPADDLPLNDRFTFFLKSAENFPRAQQIEIASSDGALDTRLGIAEGTLVLANRHTVLATIDPMKLFGPSAFGPLRLRAIAPDGTPGDWLPLVTVVRLPNLTDLRCTTQRPAARRARSQRAQQQAQPPQTSAQQADSQPDTESSGSAQQDDTQQGSQDQPQQDQSQPCTLTGSDLYLIDSVSASPDFDQPTSVPEGSMATTLPIGRPVDGTIYLRLRDDPATTDRARMHLITIPDPIQPAPSDAHLSAQRQMSAPAPTQPGRTAPAAPQPVTQPTTPAGQATVVPGQPATQPIVAPAAPAPSHPNRR